MIEKNIEFSRYLIDHINLDESIPTDTIKNGVIFIQGALTFVGIYQWHKKISIDGNMLMVYINCY